MNGLYIGEKEYILIEKRILVDNINELDDSIKKFVIINIKPKLNRESWYIGKSMSLEKDIGVQIITNEHILATEFKLIEETTEGYETLLNRVKKYSYKPMVTIYF